MKVQEHRDLAICCRANHEVKLAEYHEKRAADEAKKLAPKPRK